MLRVQRKYSCMLCAGFYIELFLSKTQVRTTNRKKLPAILLVGASEFFRDLKKSSRLSGNDALKQQMGKASFQ